MMFFNPLLINDANKTTEEYRFLSKKLLDRKLRIFLFISNFQILFLSNFFSPAVKIGTIIFRYQYFCFSTCFLSFLHSLPFLPLGPLFCFVSEGDRMEKAKHYFLWKKRSPCRMFLIRNMLPFFFRKWAFFSYYVSVNKRFKKTCHLISCSYPALFVGYSSTPRSDSPTNKCISLTKAEDKFLDGFSCLWLLLEPHTNSCSRLKSSLQLSLSLTITVRIGYNSVNDMCIQSSFLPILVFITWILDSTVYMSANVRIYPGNSKLTPISK